MMTRRKVICLLSFVVVVAWFTSAQLDLDFSLASNASAAFSQTPQTLSVPVDSPRWDLQGQAKAAEYQGRKCLLLDGGAAILKDLEMRDGVVTPVHRHRHRILQPDRLVNERDHDRSFFSHAIQEQFGGFVSLVTDSDPFAT